MTEPEPKPCPFCNGIAKIRDSLFCVDMKQIECINCGALSCSHRESTVIKYWNNRHHECWCGTQTVQELSKCQSAFNDQQEKYKKAIEFIKEIKKCKWMQAVEIRLATELLRELGEI